MKLPLWCKGRDGKYHCFPYEILQTLPNGKLGICYGPSYDWSKAYAVLTKLCEETGWDSGHFFDYSPSMDAYVLKEEPDE